MMRVSNKRYNGSGSKLRGAAWFVWFFFLILCGFFILFLFFTYISLNQFKMHLLHCINMHIYFRFMYFEDNGIDESNVISVLYAAEKYAVSELVGVCKSFLESYITEDNVCVIMENARMFNIAELLTKCKNFIFGTESVAKRVFKSGGFLELRRETLLSLVESDELPLDEYFIYQSITRWAKHNCVMEGKISLNTREIREMLGNIIFEVRFLNLSLKQYWKNIATDEILTDEEKIHVLKVIVGKSTETGVFKSSERKRCVKILRLHSDATVCEWRHAYCVDAIKFKVDKIILLHGILLYGNSRNQYTFDVEIKIIYPSDIVLVHILPKKIEDSCKMFQILFDKPCTIKPTEKYTVWMKMNGPQSYRGNYSEFVDYKGYKFKFYESNYSNNGTCVSMGQIPGLLCSLI